MIEGRLTPGFEPVEAAFAASFAELGEIGAAVAVMVEGELVVDIWGGWADLARTRPWERETLVNAYSIGKPIVSTLLLQLVEAGAIELDDPVASCWPAFAAKGKEGVTLRHALAHQAGVPAIREPLGNEDLWDFGRMCGALAATEPWWPAGERHAYHTNTFGHLIGGIIVELTGRLPGEHLAALAGALDADLHFGLPDSEHHRCAEVDFDTRSQRERMGSPAGSDEDQVMTLLGYANPPGYSSLGVVNTPEWRRAQIPSTNGHMTARGVARFYDALLQGEVLAPELLAEAVRPHASGHCPTLGQHVTFGLGFQPWSEQRPFGHNPGGFGHYGAGGSLGFADPATGVAFGYLMNHVVPRWQSPRNRALVDAVYASLG